MSLFGPPNVDRLESQRNVEGLIKALSFKKDWMVQTAAARALGKIGDAHAVEPLISLLSSNEGFGSVSAVAAEALGEIGDACALVPLIDYLAKSTKKDAQKNAARALGKIGDARAVEPLINLLNIDEVGAEAAQALGRIGDPRAVEPLIAALINGKQDELRWRAANALGECRDPRAIEPLSTILENTSDSILQEYAKAALDKISSSGSQVMNLKQEVSIQSEILRFLTSERTRRYEAENNSYWSLGDLVLVITKTGMQREWGDVSVTDLVVNALTNLYRQGKISLNTKYVSSNNVEVNAKYIHELQTETQPLFRAK